MSPSGKQAGRRSLQALEVHQWLEDWDEGKFDPQPFCAKPPEAFYLFTLGASELRSLAGIFRRSTEGGTARSLDLGIQRRHEVERSEEIGEFVKHGFPWSSLSKQRRESGEFEDLKKPGWLPTAIVVHILTNGDTRDGKSVHPRDQIEVRAGKAACEVLLPQSFEEATWHPENLPPIEVIDGQHRLWPSPSETPRRATPCPSWPSWAWTSAGRPTSSTRSISSQKKSTRASPTTSIRC